MSFADRRRCLTLPLALAKEETDLVGRMCHPDRNSFISVENAIQKQYIHFQFKTNTVQLKTP